MSEGIPKSGELTNNESKEETFGSLRLVSETVWNADVPMRAKTIISNGNERPELVYDQRIVEKRIKTDPSGMLVDFPATKGDWGSSAGKKPEEFLGEIQENALGVCPSNWGWQAGAFLIEKGNLVVSAIDEGLTGRFEGIAVTDSGWEKFSIEIKNGNVNEADKEKLARFNLGFSMPLILEDGKEIDLGDKMSDPRFTADLRNVFDFGSEKKLPDKFWKYLKRLLPSTYVSGKRLLQGRPVVIRREDVLNEEELRDFQEIVSQNHLDNVLNIDTRRGAPRLSIIGKLPFTKLPVVGVGFDNDGHLIVTEVDGRQQASAGATIGELAQIMKARGAVTAGLGCAGGDVAIVSKNAASLEILNKPSNVDSAGHNVTRPVPSMLIMRE